MWEIVLIIESFHGQYAALHCGREGEVYLIWKSEGGLPLSVNKQ